MGVKKKKHSNMKRNPQLEKYFERNGIKNYDTQVRLGYE